MSSRRWQADTTTADSNNGRLRPVCKQTTTLASHLAAPSASPSLSSETFRILFFILASCVGDCPLCQSHKFVWMCCSTSSPGSVSNWSHRVPVVLSGKFGISVPATPRPRRDEYLFVPLQDGYAFRSSITLHLEIDISHQQRARWTAARQ